MSHTPEQIATEMREMVDTLVAKNLPAIMLIDHPDTVQFIVHRVDQEKLFSLALQHVEHLLRHLTPAGRQHVVACVTDMVSELDNAEQDVQPYATVQ